MSLDFDELPPHTNRGESKEPAIRAKAVAIDWFSMTYMLELMSAELMVSLLTSFAARYVKRCKFNMINSKRNGFENRFVVYVPGGEFAAFSWGGNRGWAQLELRGELCSRMMPHDWRLFKWAAMRLAARLTRVDLAFDCYNGEMTIDALDRAFRTSKKNVMNFRGREPVLEVEGCVEKGRSRYISISGRRRAAKCMNVYEKGIKNSGRKLNADCDMEETVLVDARKWVRAELRVKRRNDFEIPYDILDPSRWFGYIGGFGPFFSALRPPKDMVGDLKFCGVRQVKIFEFNARVRRSIIYQKKQFGKFHHFMTLLLGEELYTRLLSDETEVWGPLEVFPGWEQDETFKELVAAAALPLISPGLQDEADAWWKDAANESAYLAGEWLQKDTGCLYPHSRIQDRPPYFKLVRP